MLTRTPLTGFTEGPLSLSFFLSLSLCLYRVPCICVLVWGPQYNSGRGSCASVHASVGRYLSSRVWVDAACIDFLSRVSQSVSISSRRRAIVMYVFLPVCRWFGGFLRGAAADGCTAVVVLVHVGGGAGQVYVAGLGDSAAYLARRKDDTLHSKLSTEKASRRRYPEDKNSAFSFLFFLVSLSTRTYIYVCIQLGKHRFLRAGVLSDGSLCFMECNDRDCVSDCTGA